MSNVPEGAPISDDGQWWWDGENWQPIEGGYGYGDSDSNSGYGQEAEHSEWNREGDGGETKAPAFDFNEVALQISAEAGGVESEGEPLKVSFAVCNTGTAAGTARVTLWIDGSDTGLSYESPELAPGQCSSPDDGYIHDIPGQSQGLRKFEVFADPPGPYGGWTSNEIDIRPPE